MPYRYSYRGDPGIFSFLGGVAKTVVRNLPGPAGTIGRIITGGTPPMTSSGRSPYQMVAQRQVRQMPAPGMVAALQRAVPGGATGMMDVPRGYRYNKSGYFTKDGQYHAPGTKLVRVRTRNPANVRALRRALSRVESFGGIVKRARKTTRRLRTI